jgi:MerR family transcriptional regulator, light-induced transcriptional regulator
MNDRSPQAQFALSIGAVERDTGLSKDTLRVWERRYGFPAPARDDAGERLYSPEQVEKLRLLKRLIDLGHRPARIIGLSLSELQQIAQAGAVARNLERPPMPGERPGLIDLVTAHRPEQLRNELAQVLLREGLAPFITGTIAPLNEQVGDAWTRGALAIYEEHLYTECVQGVLRHAVNSIPRSAARPRVLLTTFPQEQHGLGILMAEAMFALENCRCVSLGVQTPLPDIVRAVASQGADIVALSFSSAMNGNQVLEGLAQLRDQLAAEVEIWAGGACPVLHRRPPAGVLALRRLEDIGASLRRWRGARGSDSAP